MKINPLNRCFKTFRLAISMLLLLGISLSGHAAPKMINVGPKVTDMAPALSALNSNGQPTNIQQLQGDKGLVLVFFRSADWCRFCKKHLVELNEYTDKFKALGYGIAAISYDDPETLKTFSDERALTYPLLSDIAAKTMTDYKVLRENYKPDSDHYGIPYPGVIVMDAKSVVTYKYFYKGYKKRVKFAQLYQELQPAKL